MPPRKRAGLGGFRRDDSPAAPQQPGRPALRLVSSQPSSAAAPRDPEPGVGGPWRYWLSVLFADGHTGTCIEHRRTRPLLSSEDQRECMDALSRDLGQPVASIRFISQLAGPNSSTGEPEPVVAAHLRTSQAGESLWRYRVSYVTDDEAAKYGTSVLDLSGPVFSYAEVQAIQDAISADLTSKRGHPVIAAAESFSLQSAPAQPSVRGLK